MKRDTRRRSNTCCFTTDFLEKTYNDEAMRCDTMRRVDFYLRVAKLTNRPSSKKNNNVVYESGRGVARLPLRRNDEKAR